MPAATTFTIEQYAEMPAVYDADGNALRDELFEGEIIVSPRASAWHRIETAGAREFFVIYPTYLKFYDLLEVMSFELSKTLGMTELTTTQEYDSLASQELSIIFKHSPTCPTSLFAHREVSRFCQKQPNAPVYLISVRRQREIARHVAQCTGVRHESPQIVVLRRGYVLAAASHDAITAEWIASAVASHAAQ